MVYKFFINYASYKSNNFNIIAYNMFFLYKDESKVEWNFFIRDFIFKKIEFENKFSKLHVSIKMIYVCRRIFCFVYHYDIFIGIEISKIVTFN